jgi:hypothetical protein
MPAIDPARLARQADELAAILEQPELLRPRLRDLLEGYADRVRQPKPGGGEHGAVRVFGTAPAALRALEAAFKARTASSSDLALWAAEGLWSEGSRESCLLACSVLSGHATQSVMAWVESQAMRCQDGAVLACLGQIALRSWALEDPEAFLQAAARWLANGNREEGFLALSALGARVLDLPQDRLPAVIDLLRGRTARVSSEVRRAIVLTVRALAARSPSEAASFLLDELASQSKGVERLISETIEAFPESHRRRLLSALSQ